MNEQLAPPIAEPAQGGAVPTGPVSGVPASSPADATGFYQTARTLGRSPLGIIALFIVLVYSVAGIVAATSEGLTHAPIICFITCFPVLVLIVFTFLIIYHHQKLYAPGDFSDQRNWMRLQPNLVDLQETVVTLQNAAARGGLLPEQLNAIGKLDQFMKDIEDRTGLNLARPIQEKITGNHPGGVAKAGEAKMESMRLVEDKVRPNQKTKTEERTAITDPEDPNKGRFGKQAQRNGWRLDVVDGRVRRLSNSEWFQFELRVTRDLAESAKTGMIEFHLHDSFAQPVQRVKLVNGEASLSIVSYGSFTVGAIMPDGTELELDLADPTIKSPTTFKER